MLAGVRAMLAGVRAVLAGVTAMFSGVRDMICLQVSEIGLQVSDIFRVLPHYFYSSNSCTKLRRTTHLTFNPASTILLHFQRLY